MHTVVSRRLRFIRSFIMKTAFYLLSPSVSRFWAKTTLPSSRSSGRSQRRCWMVKTTRSKPLWLQKRWLQRMLPLMEMTRTEALARLENIKSKSAFNFCLSICLDAHSTIAPSMSCQHISMKSYATLTVSRDSVLQYQSVGLSQMQGAKSRQRGKLTIICE